MAGAGSQHCANIRIVVCATATSNICLTCFNTQIDTSSCMTVRNGIHLGARPQMASLCIHECMHVVCATHCMRWGARQLAQGKLDVTVIWVTMKASWSCKLKIEHKTNDQAPLALQAGSRLTPSMQMSPMNRSPANPRRVSTLVP
jgi:hypothetical protein